MSVREIDRFLEQWQMGAKDLRRRMILALTPREREPWHAIWLLAQDWSASDTAGALRRDPHTIRRWASAFGEGGPAALIFEQTGVPPALGQARQEELRAAAQTVSQRKADLCLATKISLFFNPIYCTGNPTDGGVCTQWSLRSFCLPSPNALSKYQSWGPRAILY